MWTKLIIYLTLSVLRPNLPQPSRGGAETRAVMSQMVTMVIRVERGVLSGNWRSLVTIMNLGTWRRLMMNGYITNITYINTNTNRCQCHGWYIQWVFRCKKVKETEIGNLGTKVTFNFILISHLWSASTVKEMIDWIPKIIKMYFFKNRLIRNKTWPVNVFLTVQCFGGV